MIKILLDIDGTLLPTRLSDTRRPILKLPKSSYSLRFYADIIHELSDLSKRDNCEIIMCTSWEETSLEIVSALEIQCNHYLRFFQENSELWYKWESILLFCEQHPTDKIILCDDLASPAFTKKRPRNLIKIFQPNPAIGLTMKDLKKIKKIVLSNKK